MGLEDGRAGPAEVFFKRPIAAAAGLARDDQVEARHEGDQLAARAGLGLDRASAGMPRPLRSPSPVRRAGSSQPWEKVWALI